MKTSVAAALVLGLGLASAAWAGEEADESGAPTVQTDPTLFYLDHQDVSPPLRDMPVIPPGQERRRQISPENVRRMAAVPEAPKGWVDPLEHLSQGEAPAPEVGTTAGLNFYGVGKNLGTYSPSVAPPDTNGAVGATQYVQWVNLHFAVFNKTTGALQYGPAAGTSLWQGFGGPCESYNSGDPIATYDKLAGRWVMTQFAFASSTSGPWYQCVAVSTTSDATGSYRRFAYNFTALNDYPKVGVWPDGYYVTFNMFYGTPSAGYSCVLDRANMISATLTPRPIQCFSAGSYWSLMPADLDGTTAPPAGSPNFQIGLGTSTTLRLWKFKVNWTTPSSSTFTGPSNITVASWTAAGTVSQAGTTQKLDVLSDRPMYRLAYRKFSTYEALVFNHSVTTSLAPAGVRWYEIRNPNGTPSVYQSGTFSPDSTGRWMGSIAQDKQGNMLVGYSASSASIYPAIRYTGRLVTDALGTMQSENTLVSGGGAQTGLGRWGDYSAMTVDPVDDCTFWFTTEYLATTGSYNWSTRVGSFKFPGCGTTSCGAYTFTCDDGDACFSKFGPAQYWFTATTCGGTSLGYNGDMIWTYVNGTVQSNYARWAPTLPCAANYTVSVYVPRCNATSQQARYRIYHNGVSDYATVNQNNVYDAWVTLGTYYFSNNGTEYVELSDATGEAGSTLRQLGFDAVRFSK